MSVDPPQVAAAFRAGLGARWTFLSDAGRHDQAELGLRETTDTVHRPYRPASFLLAPRHPPGLERLLALGRPTNEELRQGFRP